MERLRRHPFFLAVVCALILLVPIAIAAAYNHPSYDDFSYSLITKDATGPFDLAVRAVVTSIIYWHGWQGLYASTVVMSLNPDIFDCYWATPLIIALSVWAGAAFLAKSIQSKLCHSAGHEWIAASFFLVFFFVQAMPDPSEGLFWYNGAANYLIFDAIFLFAVGVYVRCLSGEVSRRTTVGLAIAAALLSFIVSGGNHVTAFANLLTLALLILVSLRNVKERKAWLLLPFATAIAGFALSLTAPGTAARQSLFSSHPDVTSTLWNCLWHAFDITSGWFSPGLLVFLALLVPLFLRIKPEGFHTSHLATAFLALLPFLSVWALYCPMMYAMGSYGSGRSDDAIYLIFICECVALAAYLTWTFAPKALAAFCAGEAGNRRIAVFTACCVIVLALPVYGHQSTSHVATTELKNGTLQAYDAAQDERLEAIDATSAGGSVGLTQIPETRLFHASLDPDEEAAYLNIHWTNSAETDPLVSMLIDRYGGDTNYYDRVFYDASDDASDGTEVSSDDSGNANAPA